MPNRNGQTFIEMDPKDSRSHESPSVHSSHLDTKPRSRGSSPSDWRRSQSTSHPNNTLHNNTSAVPQHKLSTPLISIDHVSDGEKNRKDFSHSHQNLSGTDERLQPLLEKEVNNQKPPLAGPETDNSDDDFNTPLHPMLNPGVDDGFYDNGHDIGKLDPDIHSRFGEDGKPITNDGKKDSSDIPATEKDIEKAWRDIDQGGDEHDGFIPHEDPAPRPTTPFPYPPDHAPGAERNPLTPDVNVYQQKKNLAQGMMDLALLSANANQLRYVLEAGDYHPYYYASLVFISASLILQISVAIGLIENSRYNVNDENHIHRADLVNNYTVIGVFLITVLNIVLSAFIGVGIGLIMNSRYDVKEHDDICKADRINDFTVIGIFLITVVNVFIASFGVADIPRTATNT